MPSLGQEEGEQAGRVSRRQFARASVTAGMAASAAIWVAPQLSSVALAETTSGSPPPSTAPPDGGDAGEPLTPGQASGTAGTGGTGASGAGTGTGGELPMTGANVRKLAVTGGAALASGSALIGVERLTRRHRPQPAPDVEGPTDETGR